MQVDLVDMGLHQIFQNQSHIYDLIPIIECVIDRKRAVVGRKASHSHVLITTVGGGGNASGKVFGQSGNE